MVKFIDTMPPRDPGEAHRASTPLELLFDLATVIAIAACAAGLHHGLAAGHGPDAIGKFAIALFAVWWAWMNYTWFASAYDNNDAVFRIATFVIIGGAVTMAVGIDALFESLDIGLVILGYVIMRLPLALLWLRAAQGDPARRMTGLLYAGGLVLVQAYWVSLLALPSIPERLLMVAIGTGFVLELLVPVFAERRASTPWHHDHIEERYGLLTIIVLGEVLLSAAISLRTAGAGEFDIAFVHIAMSAVVLAAAMWWLYFPGGRHLHSHELPDALAWGYGHILIFGSVAAVGAGFSLLVDIVAGKSAASLATGDLAVGIPLLLYMFGLWLVRDRHLLRGWGRHTLLAFALLTLAALALSTVLEGLVALAVGAVIARELAVRRLQS